MADYDLFVIGAGSGGLACAKRAALHGKRVAIAEYSKVGGTCVIRGCVPKKIMAYAGAIADTLDDAPGYGFDIGTTPFDFASFAAKRNAEIDRLNTLHISLLEKSGVDLKMGRATLVDAHTVRIGDETFSADTIMVAVGGAPTLPLIPGAAEHGITSDGVWELNTLPETLVVVGGGYIAVEFASIFAALGSKVHVIIRRAHILAGFDAEIYTALQDEMEKRGITFHTHSNITQLTKGPDGRIEAALDTGEALHADTVLFATGRRPSTDGLGLKQAGVDVQKNGVIPVNARLQTSCNSIYAIGDVIDRVNLTPVAIKHGRMVAENLYNGASCNVDDEAPTAVFSTPPLGTVGLTEEAARAAYGDDVETYHSRFRPMLYVLAERDEKALMKMVVQRSTQRVLGLHMVGRDAPEIIQGFAVAVRMGATKADLDATVAIHPSSAEEFVLMT